MRALCLFVIPFVMLAAANAQNAGTPADSVSVVVVAQDSLAKIDTSLCKIHNPKKAVWLSAACPGLGQIYNRKYWKIPIIYGAFVGLSYGIAWNHQYFKSYKTGYIDFLNQTPNPTWQNLVIAGQENNSAHIAWVQQVLKQKRDRYRRYRDMSIIGLAGIYVLNIVDAFVDAQLMDFDISQDLSLNVAPDLIQNRDRSKAVGVHLNLHF